MNHYDPLLIIGENRHALCVLELIKQMHLRAQVDMQSKRAVQDILSILVILLYLNGNEVHALSLDLQ